MKAEALGSPDGNSPLSAGGASAAGAGERKKLPGSLGGGGVNDSSAADAAVVPSSCVAGGVSWPQAVGSRAATAATTTTETDRWKSDVRRRFMGGLNSRSRKRRENPSRAPQSQRQSVPRFAEPPQPSLPGTVAGLATTSGGLSWPRQDMGLGSSECGLPHAVARCTPVPDAGERAEPQPSAEHAERFSADAQD